MSSPPTIAHIAMPLAPSGSAITNIIRDLCREHAAVGGTSYVALSHNRDTVVDHAENLYVDHTEVCPREWFSPLEMKRDHAAGALGLNRPYTSRLAIPAIRAVVDVDPDVVVIHEGHYASSTLPRWRKALPNTRLVSYVNTPLSRSYLRPELARLLRPCDDIIFVSDFMRRQLAARVGLKLRTHIILNGTRPDASLMRAMPAEVPTLLFVGQVGRHKGPHLLIAATAELIRRGHKVKTMIVGSSIHGPEPKLTKYERELRTAATPLGDAVNFMPFVPNSELGPLYRSATVVAVPSIWDDPCPLVVLESIGTGAPVVGTRRGGIPEIGLDAISYSGESGESLADAIEPLISDQSVRDEFSIKALARAHELTWTKQYQSFAAAIAG